jgi:hypothetical protein
VKNIWLLVLSIPLFLIPAAGQCVQDAVVTNAFRGTVFASFADLNREPLSGVKISIKRGGNTVATTTTDSKGAFVVEKLKPGSYLIDVDAEHFPRFAMQITLRKVKKIDKEHSLDIRLNPASSRLDLCTGLITVKTFP